MPIGNGYENRMMTLAEAESIVAQSIDNNHFNNKRILVVIPDHTRTAPIGLMFKTLYKHLAKRVKHFDVLIALGTHPPMPMEQIYQRVEITSEEHHTVYPKARFFNHLWKDPHSLTTIGTISEERINELSRGMFRMNVNIQINKMLLDYDHIMIVGPVFPHEVVGFSGGDKYIFPGVAGQEIIDFFHWLGACITNMGIIGRKMTPVREVIQEAVKYLPIERSAFCLVVKGSGLAGLYYGEPPDAWSAASDLSDKLHILYKRKPYHTVLSRAPEMYDDLWTGGKCMYKLEPVVADGGKLIIYAPHITEISVTHGAVLDEIGYHTHAFFAKQWNKYKKYPWGVVAHSTHVKGVGTYENGIEKPRVDVILATGIPEERCRKVNLGYMNPSDIKISEYENKEDEGILYVEKAGEILYRLY